MSIERMSTRSHVSLTVLPFAAALLAVYQWMSLIVYASGGSMWCAIGDTFDCSAVWQSGFAKTVHASTAMPIAGWGLIWGVTAFAAAVALWARASARWVHVTRLLGVVGVVTSVVLGAVSLSLGSLCLTCVATYWLVFAYAFIALRLPLPLRPASGEIRSALSWAVGLIAVAYAGLLLPGLRTPTLVKPSLTEMAPPKIPVKPVARATTTTTAPSGMDSSDSAPEASPGVIEGFIDSLTPQNKQILSDALGELRQSPPRSSEKWPTRFRLGPVSASVRLVEFMDIRCTHCAALVRDMNTLHEIVPPEWYSLEPRQFPLDSRCNRFVPKTLKDKTGVRCFAAKALICLEGAENYWKVQEKLFSAQDSLTRKMVIEIVAGAVGGRKKLKSCIASKRTSRKLAADTAYAQSYDPQGTPLLLINGRQAHPLGPLILATVLAFGDLDSPGFSRLPPPRAHDHGHGKQKH